MNIILNPGGTLLFPISGEKIVNFSDKSRNKLNTIRKRDEEDEEPYAMHFSGAQGTHVK